MVHDEGNLCSTGDVVRIEACRPISARKHFALAEVLQRRNIEKQMVEEENVEEDVGEDVGVQSV
jgi:small subunit ribosomal protein S17